MGDGALLERDRRYIIRGWVVNDEVKPLVVERGE